MVLGFSNIKTSFNMARASLLWLCYLAICLLLICQHGIFQRHHQKSSHHPAIHMLNQHKLSAILSPKHSTEFTMEISRCTRYLSESYQINSNFPIELHSPHSTKSLTYSSIHSPTQPSFNHSLASYTAAVNTDKLDLHHMDMLSIGQMTLLLFLPLLTARFFMSKSSGYPTLNIMVFLLTETRSQNRMFVHDYSTLKFADTADFCDF